MPNGTYALALCAAVAIAATGASAEEKGGVFGAAKRPSLGSVDASGVYQLSAEEQRYDCKKLTGRMQVRILQIRDYSGADDPTLLSRGLGTIASLIEGGPGGGSVRARYQADRAMLDAYNRQLAAKKCKTFDLEAELKPKPAKETPTPK